jgi:hypothetical protein
MLAQAGFAGLAGSGDGLILAWRLSYVCGAIATNLAANRCRAFCALPN